MTAIRYHRSRQSVALEDLGDEDALFITLDVIQNARVEQAVFFNSKGAEPSWRKLEELCRLPKPTMTGTREDVSRLLALHDAMDSYWHEIHRAKEPLIRSDPRIAPFAPMYLQRISLGRTEKHKLKLQEEQGRLLRAFEAKGNDTG